MMNAIMDQEAHTREDGDRNSLTYLTRLIADATPSEARPTRGWGLLTSFVALLRTVLNVGKGRRCGGRFSC
jgi:hypothetical protein